MKEEDLEVEDGGSKIKKCSSEIILSTEAQLSASKKESEDVAPTSQIKIKHKTHRYVVSGTLQSTCTNHAFLWSGSSKKIPNHSFFGEGDRVRSMSWKQYKMKCCDWAKSRVTRKSPVRI